MTVQADEVLKYRDKYYGLSGMPLSQYLDKHKEIQFEENSSAHWRGYQGYWLLEDEKLFLTDLESTNFTMHDIFKTHEPVFAKWFSGKLEFGIGNYYPDKWIGTYDFYVWLNFENGKVIDKKILKHFDKQPEFFFGKYKGKKFNEVLYGKINRNIYRTIRDFITSILEFIKEKDYRYRVQCPLFSISDQDIELIREIREYGIEYFITQSYIAISSNEFWENSIDDERASKLSILLEKILTSDFKKLNIISRQNIEADIISEKTILINGDSQYLIWALKTVRYFSVPPNQLEKEFIIRRLKTFKVNRLNKYVFDYEPIIETITYKFPEKTIKVNRKKFEKSNKVIYDSGKAFYTPDLSESELLNEFGYYLDENYIPQEANLDFHKYENNYDFYEFDKYCRYAGACTQEKEDFSNDTNDDVDDDIEAFLIID